MDYILLGGLFIAVTAITFYGLFETEPPGKRLINVELRVTMAGRSWQQIFIGVWFLVYGLLALVPALAPLSIALVIFAFCIALAVAANK